MSQQPLMDGGYPQQQQGGYPPQQGAYPPQQGYPPQGAYPPPGPPEQQGYPPQQQAYPPQPPGGYGPPPGDNPYGQPPPGDRAPGDNYNPYGPGLGQQPPPQQGGYPAPGQPPMGGYPPQAPPQQAMGGMPPGGMPGATGPARLLGVRKMIVQQKVSLLEAATGGCCEVQNEYETFDADTGAPLFYAKEDSECCCRMCCNPHHRLNLTLSPFTGGGQKGVGGRAQPGPQEMQIHRPFKCHGSCMAVSDCCQQEATIYHGAFEGEPQETAGIEQRAIGKVQEPCGGGGCSPKVLMSSGGSEFAQVIGPTCCFGGVTEYCCDQEFLIDAPGAEKQGQLGKIIREKPGDISGAMKTMFTDADTFTIEFHPQQTAEQRATMLAAMLLMDYMFFETDGLLSCEDGKIKITCCNLYCCGALHPIKCTLCGGDNKDGD